MGAFPALAIGQALPETPLEAYQKAATLKLSLAQQQAVQQETQQRAAAAPIAQQQAQANLNQTQQRNQADQLALQDQQKMRQLAAEHVTKGDDGKVTGFDVDGFAKNALANGVSPQTVNEYQKNYAEGIKANLALSDEQLKQESAKNARFGGMLEDIKGLKDPASRQKSWESALMEAAKHNIDVSQFPAVVPDNDGISTFEIPLGIHAQVLADTKTQSEIAKNMRGTVEEQELADFTKKNPGKGPADFAKWKASLSPLAQISVANAAGGGMEQGAVDQAAEYYHMTGKLPPGGRGVAGLAQNRKIMNRASELYPGSMTADSGAYSANLQSLKGLQKQFDQVTAFENTAGKNLDVFLNQANKVVDSGSPWINKPLRSVAGAALGSEDQAAFNAARATALTEIAKVLNSSNASGVLSDSARHEVEGLIGGDATLKQIVSAAKILKTDMENRRESYQDQIKDIQGRMSTKPQGQDNAAPGGFDWNKFPTHK